MLNQDYNWAILKGGILGIPSGTAGNISFNKSNPVRIETKPPKTTTLYKAKRKWLKEKKYRYGDVYLPNPRY
jgi:hypothetical protein